MRGVPDDWPYAEEATACAVCGNEDVQFVTVESLGLVWGAAMQGGLPPTDVGDYGGTLEFRCCRDCWISEGIDALEEATTLLDEDVERRGNDRFALDDEKVAAAAKLHAERVAVDTVREIEFQSDPERDHVRAQDRAVEAVLQSWFAEE